MIIGITGSRGSGKSTAAEVLKKEFGFIEYSFAKPLKEICKLMFGLTDEQVYGDYIIKETIDERLGISPREILQKFGTEFGRQILHILFPDLKIPKGELWLQHFKWWYEKNKVKIVEIKSLEKPDAFVLEEQEINIVFPDVRFVNEARIIKETGGIILKVERPDLETDSNHSSELEMVNIECDVEVLNDGTLEEFQNKIKNTKEILKFIK